MLIIIFCFIYTITVHAEKHTFFFSVTLGSEAPDCVERDVIEINGAFIGPEIRVRQGDDVTIHVMNLLPAIEVTVH